MRRHVIICLILAGVTLGLYWPVSHYDLIHYDDPVFLTDTPEIQAGLTGNTFRWSFSSVILGNWHPLTTLSFILDHQFFGTNPGAEHLVNVLFHAANAALVYLLLSTMTRCRWRSALVAAVFAWHPLRVESVAWITERKDVLCGFFFLLTLLFYEKQAGRKIPRSKVYYALSLLAFALGLMSKAMLVTVPFVLLLLDIWPLKRWGWANSHDRVAPASPSADAASVPKIRGGVAAGKLIWEKWPYFLMSAVFSVLTFIVQKNAGAVNTLTHLGWNYRVANAITSYARYLGKLVWPVDLAVIYPYRRIDDWTLPGLILLALAVVSAVCAWQLRRRPWLAVGWFWYLGMSVPIIGLVQVGEASMCDRYTYLTLLGPVLALAWLIPEVWAQDPVRKVWLGISCAAGLGALIILTREQIGYWHDSTSLFAHTVAVTRDNPGGEQGWGIGLEHEKHYDEALTHFRAAQALDPASGDNFLKSGYMLTQQGKWLEAEKDLAIAENLEPNNVLVQESLAGVLPHLGRSVEAARHLEVVLRITPDATEAMNNLAWLLATSSDATARNGPRAVEVAQHACELTHYQKTVYLGTLGAAYAEAGRFDDAIATAEKACASASAHGETQLLERNQELLARYQKHQADHEAAEAPLQTGKENN